MKITSASPSSSGPSSMTNHTRMVEVRAGELEKCTGRSSETGNQNSLSAISLEQDRMSWRQPCYYVTCLSPRTPKHGAFETRCKPCFKWWQLSKPRARPHDVEGRPWRNTTSQSETKRRCRSISNCWRFLKYTFHTANMHTNSIKYHQTLEIGLFMLTKFHSFGEHMCM